MFDFVDFILSYMLSNPLEFVVRFALSGFVLAVVLRIVKILFED